MLNKKRLFTPGPTMLPEKVKLAMAQDILHHRKSEFKHIMQNVQIGLKELFGTSQPVLPLSASGTGAMVAAVSSLFKHGEKVIVINGGKFAERWIDICNSYSLNTIIANVTHGTSVTVEETATILAQHPDCRGLLIQQSETSTGAQHPIKDIATLTRERNLLLVVDGVSGVSISPCPMDEWGIDCLVTGSQKGLMLPPGLAFIALSTRAWEKAEETGLRNFYFNLLKEKNNILKGQTNFTTPVSLILGLDTSLKMFKDAGGIKEIFKKQWAMTMMVRAGVESLALELFVKKNFAWGLTSIVMPEGINSSEVIAHAAKNYGAYFAAGQGELKEKLVRFGHMGWIDYADILGGLYALTESLLACGAKIITNSYMESAMVAYESALAKGYPLQTNE